MSVKRPSARDRGAGTIPVVGIGASAGGLAALEAFFSGIPAGRDTGMAYVVVQHLAPDHKSLLAELLRRQTRMHVFEAEDGMDVRGDCVYIIPPGFDMAYAAGKLCLQAITEPHGRRLSIDFLFRSLATELEGRAIGVVLSGTGSDGAEGLRAIKGQGGVAVAQSPESAEFDAMPRNAIATGIVDQVLPPSDMGRYLVTYAARAFSAAGPARSRSRATLSDEAAVTQILAATRTVTGHDFAGYKMGTVLRRIERRRVVNHLEHLGDYLDLVRSTPAEAGALSQEMLIGVTTFFRDPEAFDALRRLVIGPLVARPDRDAPIRAWVPACSTGEEAYSIAILINEEMEAAGRTDPVQIFATDIDPQAIRRARAGRYPAGIAADLTPDRLARYFVEEPGGAGYRVHSRLRDLVVFSDQDLVRDPPFSRLDLITCRNVMIYMGAELHDRLVALFNYALVPGGALVLGMSEGLGRRHELFTVVDRAAKIYRRRDPVVGASPVARRAIGSPGLTQQPRRATDASLPHDGRARLQQLVERELLADDPRVAALATARGDILYLHGRTGQYLEPAPGQPDFNILKMARDGLRHDLASAFRLAVMGEERVARSGLRVPANGDEVAADLEVRRVEANESGGEPLFLVILAARPAMTQPAASANPGDLDGGAATGPDDGADPPMRLVRLERELRASEAYLNTTVGQLESANDELASSNEELQSVNEELQSANEELETSKEELQSANEELGTINAELQATVSDLSHANNDLNNFVAGTGIATVFVDSAQRIGRFTSGATAILNLIAGDVGRPLSNVVSNIVSYDRLTDDVQAVLDSLVPIETEVRTRSGSWYLLGIRPYRTIDNLVEGAVLTFTDTTQWRRREAIGQVAASLRGLADLIRGADDAIAVQDGSGHIVAWNPAATRMLGWSEPEALAMSIRDLVRDPQRPVGPGPTGDPLGAGVPGPYATGWAASDGRVVDVSLVATPLVDADGARYAIATTIRLRAGTPDASDDRLTLVDVDHA